MKRAFCMLGLLAALGANAADARADTSPRESAMDEAREHYKRGVALYESGSFNAALEELERANRLAPSFKIRYSMALVQLQLNDFAAALASFSEYLAQGGTQVPAARRAEVEQQIAKLRDRVATLQVTASVDGAQIAVDGVVVGTSPLASPLTINTGHHRVSASLDGYQATTKEIAPAGGERVSLRIELLPVAPAEPQPPAPLPAPTVTATPPPAPPPAAPAPPPPAPRADLEPRPVPWVAWGVAGGLGVLATASGVVALSAASDLHSKKNDGPASASDLDSLSSRAKGWALASDVFTGATVIASGVALYLTLTRNRTSIVTVGIAPNGLRLRAGF